MKVRTITGFLHLKNITDRHSIRNFSEKLLAIKKELKNKIKVQFVRISFQNLDSLVDLSRSESQIVKDIQYLETLCNKTNITLINIGTITGKSLTPRNIKILGQILKNTRWVFGSVKIDRWDEEIFEACAKMYKTLSRVDKNGLANIKYSTLFNVPPDSPFYPGAYHLGKKSAFALGLEWGEELIAVSKNAKEISQFSMLTSKILEKKLKLLEKKLFSRAKQLGLEYKGIDLSLATSLGKISTLPTVWKNIGIAFGENGSLAIVRAITKAIEQTKIKKCGYNGLMIPIMEDFGLAKISKHLSVEKILMYSAVCGTGLDTIPLPGNISIKELSNILKDIYSLSEKWNKPLSARLFPIPGKHVGQKTNMHCPYLVDAYVME